MAKQIHYEVFVARTGDRSWVLHQTHDERAGAMNAAKYALLQNTFSGARVVKETHNLATGEYLPITVFEEGGPTTTKVSVRRSEDVHLPCAVPGDLYAPDARAAISRVLEDTLKHECLTAMELLHRADVLESLQARGTVLQHAMQKWAVTHAAAENMAVTEIMKQLNTLVSRGMERVFKEARAREVPKITNGNLGPVWDEACKASEPSYVVNCAIARTLSKVDGLLNKLPVLMNLMEHLPNEEPGQKICLDSIDAFVTDMISGRADLEDFLGAQPELGASLTVMIDLFLGKMGKSDAVGHKGLKQLASAFDSGRLPHARQAVINRVLQELNGLKRLCPGDVHREVTLTRQLAKRMVLCQGQMVSIDDIVSAFESRCTRLTTPEMVEDYMAIALTLDERVELLLDLESNIIGDANKARLVHYILPILTGPKMERLFLKGDDPLLRRLGRLAALQARALASGFADAEKKEIVEDIDKLSFQVEAEGKLFSSITRRPISGAEKAMTLLRLLDAKVLTEGTCTLVASRHVLKLMRDPAFISELAHVKFPPDPSLPQDPVERFRGLVEKTGVQQRVQRSKEG